MTAPLRLVTLKAAHDLTHAVSRGVERRGLRGSCVDSSHVQNARQIFARKWDLVVLTHLSEGPLRYMQLARAIRKEYSELTEGVLSKTLRHLTDAGLVHQVPLTRSQRAHALTADGRSIVGVLAQISELYDKYRRPDASADGSEPDELDDPHEER
ncbi:winged helix-turn-helix transcriptional regulator [Dactylosporangium sp. NPDC000244]|uniref:winged helix-turn-helix transcriptional regulator n=1 Tax=Dactylosporangium sp. NPDC000244 TaxID=3154365 RepID=UPI003330DF8B